jgi:hypothetical protein
MTQESPSPVKPATTPTLPPSPAFAGLRHAVTGLVPPEIGEARIRETLPTVVAVMPAQAQLAQVCMRSIVLAPLGWLLLAPLFALRLAPFLCRRYTLTNRRLMIQRGLKPSPVEEIALKDIDEVRFQEGSYNEFYRCGTLEVISKGQTRMTLVGVREPESFRQAIINACTAWVPEKSKLFGFLPASTK